MLDALPAKAALYDRLLALLQAGMVGSPAVMAESVFTLEREGDQDQAALVVRSAADRNRTARTLVDPHGLAGDHTASIDWFSPSPDGRLVAYGVSEGEASTGSCASSRRPPGSS